jgi:hypothetical protein
MITKTKELLDHFDEPTTTTLAENRSFRETLSKAIPGNEKLVGWFTHRHGFGIITNTSMRTYTWDTDFNSFYCITDRMFHLI